MTTEVVHSVAGHYVNDQDSLVRVVAEQLIEISLQLANHLVCGLFHLEHVVLAVVADSETLQYIDQLVIVCLHFEINVGFGLEDPAILLSVDFVILDNRGADRNLPVWNKFLFYV